MFLRLENINILFQICWQNVSEYNANIIEKIIVAKNAEVVAFVNITKLNISVKNVKAQLFVNITE